MSGDEQQIWTLAYKRNSIFLIENATWKYNEKYGTSLRIQFHTHFILWENVLNANF